MDLKTYLDERDLPAREAFAKRAGTTYAYLIQLAGGHRAASPKLAKALHKASRCEIALSAIRPDIWSESEVA